MIAFYLHPTTEAAAGESNNRFLDAVALKYRFRLLHESGTLMRDSHLEDRSVV